MESMAIFWAVYLVYMLVVLGLAVASYVLQALGFYTIAKRRGIRNPWMAWVPVAEAYLLGCISDQYQYVVKGKNKCRRKILLTAEIVMWVSILLLVAFAVAVSVGYDSYVVGLVVMYFLLFAAAIVLTVFRCIALYDVFNSCNPENSVLFLVLSIVINVTEPFFVFFNRKKDEGMPPRKPGLPEGTDPEIRETEQSFDQP